MRSMWWQLGILGTISAFAYKHKETKKNLELWLTVHRSSMWNKKPTRCNLVLYLFLLISCSL